MGWRRTRRRRSRCCAPARAGVTPGEWIYNLGGWAIEQFADDPSPFTREELDKSPEQSGVPAGLMLRGVLNSRALQAGHR